MKIWRLAFAMLAAFPRLKNNLLRPNVPKYQKSRGDCIKFAKK